MELDICILHMDASRGTLLDRRCFFKQTACRIFTAKQSDKRGGKSSLCDVSLLPLTPREGDVICRRSAQWPVCRLEWTRPRIIDSGAALKCWLSTTYPRSPHHNHRILPDCRLVYVEEEVFDPRRNPSREFSFWFFYTIIWIQGHFSWDACVKGGGGLMWVNCSL